MNRRLSVVSWPFVVLLLCSFLVHGGSTAVPNYREIRAEKRSMTSMVYATGRVQPEMRIDIKSPVAGRAEEVLVEEGQIVEKGQVLILISSTERAGLMDAAALKGAKEHRRWHKALPPTPIVAPVAGRIIQRNIQPGQTFTETEPIFVMANQLVVETPVDEGEIGRLQVGGRAWTTLDSDPHQEIISHVGSIAFDARVENDITMYMTKVYLDQTSQIIRVGMTANISFELETKHGITVIPSYALKSNGKSLYVLVPGSNNEPETRFIKTGISDGTRVEVTEGLMPGETVLVHEAEEPARPVRSFISID